MRHVVLFAALFAAALVLNACSKQDDSVAVPPQNVDPYALKEAVPAGPAPKGYQGTEEAKKQ